MKINFKIATSIQFFENWTCCKDLIIYDFSMFLGYYFYVFLTLNSYKQMEYCLSTIFSFFHESGF